MQSHPDADAGILAAHVGFDDADAGIADVHLKALKEKAEEMTAKMENFITAGKPGEPILQERQVGDIFIRQMPPDPLALRVSVGEAYHLQGSAYLVYRGDTEKVRALLERALAALKEQP